MNKLFVYRQSETQAAPLEADERLHPILIELQRDMLHRTVSQKGLV